MSKSIWPGRLLRRRTAVAEGASPAATGNRTSRRPDLPLREAAQAQADLRARLDLLARRLDATPGLAAEEREALRQTEREIRARLEGTARRLALSRRRCWLPILIQLGLLALMLAAFLFLPEF